MGRFQHEHKDGFRTVWRFPEVYNLFRAGPWSKYASNPIMEKGLSGWDSLGLRDPKLLVDLNGEVVYENGYLVMYYTGFQTAAPHYNRAIGRAISLNGLSWTKYASNPIISNGSAGAWDSFGVQFPAPIRIAASNYYMVFSGTGSDWTNWGIGVATSSNGLSWTKYASNPVLQSSNFSLAGNTILTFPSVIRASNGTWYMALGGTYAGTPDRFAVYAASSVDGYTWSVLNGGSAVLTLSGVTGLKFGAFDNVEVSILMELDPNEYLLIFNYNSDISGGKHYVGMATSSNMINWTLYSENPILEPGSTGTWEEHRVETPFIPKQDLGTGTLRLWYSGKPTVDGEDDSAFGYATSDQRMSL